MHDLRDLYEMYILYDLHGVRGLGETPIASKSRHTDVEGTVLVTY